ncbi:MAG TPA: urate hydroxylase PuuD, partial [Thauera aminoaromatica]|nr:urate hydroxylase PuuD [Thauera aminoaromatica]
GEQVDPMPGIVGKQRSVHNTYFTLPVLFIMISNHYPMTYANAKGWLVLGVLMLAGVLIRQFFVLRHRGQVKWWLPAAGVALIALLMVLMAPKQVDAGGEKVSFATVKAIMAQRCIACHADKPTFEGFAQAPKGVMLQTPEQIAAHAVMSAQTVASGYMPLGNLTAITEEEREKIAIWFAQGARTAD